MEFIPIYLSTVFDPSGLGTYREEEDTLIEIVASTICIRNSKAVPLLVLVVDGPIKVAATRDNSYRVTIFL